MELREIEERDIPAVIDLFRANYGDDYPLRTFYDPIWIKKGIYSDLIYWLVAEDAGRILGTGAVILNLGDQNDQLGEIGRIVVDPRQGGKGIGRYIVGGLVDGINDRIDFAFAEARTVHPKMQHILEHHNMAALGFSPLAYQVHQRESFVVYGRLIGLAAQLRRDRPVVIPAVLPLAQAAFHNLGMPCDVVVDDAPAYPSAGPWTIGPLMRSHLIRLLRIQTYGRAGPEVFGHIHLDNGMPRLKAAEVNHIVAFDADGEPLGAAGYTVEEFSKHWKLVEVIASDEQVRGFLVDTAIKIAEQQFGSLYLEVDVSAFAASMQATLFKRGFKPVAYLPAMVFDNGCRLDVVKMARLNIPCDPGTIELTDQAREMVELVCNQFN